MICPIVKDKSNAMNNTGGKRGENTTPNRFTWTTVVLDIGSEYHYIFECSFPNVVDIRKKHIPSYYTKYPNFQKMIGLLSLCNVPVLKNLSLFISKLRKYL
jgi:hypothetical protein